MDTMKLKVRISVVVFILSGFFAGVMADKYLLTRANDNKPAPVKIDPKVEMMQFYSGRLNMTADQTEQMGKILDETSVEYDRLREDMKPRSQAIKAGARQRIRAILTPDQQPKYDALVVERDALRQQQKNEGKK